MADLLDAAHCGRLCQKDLSSMSEAEVCKIRVLPEDYCKKGFRKRGLANGVSPFFFFLKMKLKKTRKKTEENGKETRQRKEKTEENGRNGRKRKKIGSDTVPATPFAKPRLLQERPLQFQHGNVRVKSWPTHVQLLVNF